MAKRGQIALLAAALLMLGLTSFHAIAAQNFIVAIIGVGASLTLFFLYMSLSRSSVNVRFNLMYVSAMLHMYSIATGEAGPRDLVSVVSETGQYGALSLIFKKIRALAERFGYGFTYATSTIAQATKPPLKDFLMRCTEIFSSRRPRDYLEIEVNTVIEEYSGMYSRALDNLRLMGGIFITFQSAVIFIIMTLSILTVFLAETSIVYVSYAVSILSLTLLFFGFRKVPPKDPFFYRGDEPPSIYKKFVTASAIMPAFIIPSIALYFVFGPPITFTILGIGIIIPGLFAYALEKHINDIESHYPTFIKAVSEHLMSVLDLKSVFSYVLYMELGPLRRLVKKALNRLKLGISSEETMDLLSSETGSHSIYITNRIFLDAFRRGGDIAEVGKKLSGFVVKVIDLRKKRLSTARSFEIMVIVMQPLIVILMVLLAGVLDLFSASLINLPFFTFGEIPIEFIKTTNAITILLLTFLNALSINDARGGYRGSTLLYAGILLIISATSWFFTEQFVSAYFTNMFSGLWETPI